MKRKQDREIILKDFTKNFKLYREQTSVWAVDAAKKPIKTIITEIDHSLHYNTFQNPNYVDTEDQEYRINQLKTLVEDIIIDIDEMSVISQLN